MLAYCAIDSINFPEEKEQIYAGLVHKTCVLTGLSLQEVLNIFSYNDKRVVSRKPETQALYAKEKGSITKVEYGNVSYEIPTDLWRSLKSDEQSFIEMFLRCSLLGPSSGLFWSLPPKVYEKSNSKKIEVLECFASPFNHNLPNYCSLSKPKKDKETNCYGDFFKYLSVLKKHKSLTRLVIDAPFTDRTLNKLSEELLEYFEIQPNLEIIAFLPDWSDQVQVQKLISLKGSCVYYLSHSEIVFYDKINQKLFSSFGLKMLVLVNLGMDAERSCKKLEKIKKIFSELASRLR